MLNVHFYRVDALFINERCGEISCVYCSTKEVVVTPVKWNISMQDRLCYTMKRNAYCITTHTCTSSSSAPYSS